MIYITDNTTSYKVEGDEISRNYASGGVLTIPKNTTIAILDDISDNITFKSASNYDTWFTATLGYLYIEGELVTRENIITKFNAVANSLQGGGGGGLDCCDTVQSISDVLNNFIKNKVINVLETDADWVGCELDYFAETVEEDRLYFITDSCDDDTTGTTPSTSDYNKYKAEAQENANAVILYFDNKPKQIDYYEDGYVPARQYSGTTAYKIVIGEGITDIGQYAFSHTNQLNNLKTLVLPSTLVQMGQHTFDYAQLTSIYSFANTKPSINSYAFINVKENGTLYIPQDSTASYTSIDGLASNRAHFLGYYNWTIIEN